MIAERLLRGERARRRIYSGSFTNHHLLDTALGGIELADLKFKIEERIDDLDPSEPYRVQLLRIKPAKNWGTDYLRWLTEALMSATYRLPVPYFSPLDPRHPKTQMALEAFLGRPVQPGEEIDPDDLEGKWALAKIAMKADKFKIVELFPDVEEALEQKEDEE